MKIRRLFIFAFALAFLMGLISVGYPQGKYPERAIQIIVPYGPGGSTDLCVRSFMDEVSKVLGVPITISNRPGAGGLTGTDAVANAKPDGYTLLATSAGVLTWAPAIDPKDRRDLDPVALLAVQPVVIVTKSDHKIKSFDEMVSHAKSHPGDLTCGSVGVQAETYADLALLEAAAGLKFRHVPIAQSSEGISNLLGGHIDYWVGSIAISQNLMKAGRLRGVVTAAKKRMKDFPDVPTFAEKGYPHIDVNLIIAMLGPKGLPKEVTKPWEDALKNVLGRPEIIAALGKLNYDVDAQFGTERLGKYFSDEIARFSVITKERGIRK